MIAVRGREVERLTVVSEGNSAGFSDYYLWEARALAKRIMNSFLLSSRGLVHVH